jgi:serine protease Do
MQTMKLYHKMRQQKLLSTTLLLLTLSVGILIGTLVNTGVKAARDQQGAPDASPLVIPHAEEVGNEFTKLAKKLDASVVNITADYVPKVDPQARQNRRARPPQDGDDDQSEEGMDLFRRFFGNRGQGGGGQGGMDMMPQQPSKREQSGTGFIVDRNGYVITNHHVVSDNRGNPVDHIFVKLHGDTTEYRARVIGSDSETDIAVLKIDSKRSLTPVAIANSDGVQVGDWAVAIGSPFGLEETVTAGIISATGRDINGAQEFQRFIQTDAAINPGNSGGPLLNIKGEVIGVNTMIATQNGGSQGVGFALPMNLVAKIYNDIIREGRVTRGSIGVEWAKDPKGNTTLMKAMGFDHGVIVGMVKSGGPADKAGMKVDDIILSMNGQPIKDSDDLIARVADTSVGSQITLGCDRDGKKMDFKLTVQDRAVIWADRVGPVAAPPEEPVKPEPTSTQVKFGIYPRAVSEEERELTPDKRGVTVTRVEPGSFAEEIGVQEHDIIIAINRQPVSSVDDIRKIQQTLKPGDAVAFRIVRSGPMAAAHGDKANAGALTPHFLSGILPQE